MARLHAVRKDSDGFFHAVQQTWLHHGQNEETLPYPLFP